MKLSNMCFRKALCDKSASEIMIPDKAADELVALSSVTLISLNYKDANNQV